MWTPSSEALPPNFRVSTRPGQVYNLVERLYEKWFRATPQPQTRSVYEARWAKKWRFGSSENYAAGASETFHTVSEEAFSEVRSPLGFATVAVTFRRR